MNDDIKTALTAVVERLVRLAGEEPSFRAHLLELLAALQETVKQTERRPEAQPTPETPVPEWPPEPVVSLSDVAEAETRTPSSAVPVGTEPLTPGGAAGPAAAAPEPAPAPRYPPEIQRDLAELETRCRLKAEACRWAATRRRLLAARVSFRTEIEPGDEAIIEKGKAADCYLWMCTPYSPSTDDPQPYDVIAGCFDAAAEAVALMRLLIEVEEAPRQDLEQSFHLLAEAQSSLRTASAALNHVDEDQEQLFHWLKSATVEKQIYVRRHMKLDDPANPNGAANLTERIQAARASAEQARKLKGQRKKLLGKIRHKLSLLPTADEADRQELWQAVAAIADELVSGGLPPSNRSLRELLLPALEAMPELPDVPKGFQWCLREVRRYQERSQAEELPPVEAEPSADVQTVADLLAGRCVALIGGEPRPEAKEALERAFGLQELIWVATKEHQPVSDFEPVVARPEVALVLLAIRWASHSYSDVQKYCDHYGKPLVRLPAGYNANQVAVQIQAQCSDRLAST